LTIPHAVNPISLAPGNCWDGSPKLTSKPGLNLVWDIFDQALLSNRKRVRNHNLSSEMAKVLDIVATLT
jgi:hypothetical protein